MNAQQLNTLPRLSSSQVTSYPQQSPFIPAVRAADENSGGIKLDQILEPMIMLIMMVMIMKMMTKMVDAAN